MWIRWWWMLGLIASCNDEAFDDTPRSGSRLKLASFTLDEGPHGWSPRYDSIGRTAVYDSRLGQMCSSQEWTNGKTYCTPELAGIEYSDPLCSEPLANDYGSQPHAFAAIDSGGPQPQPHRLYRVTGMREVQSVWLPDGTGNCYGRQLPAPVPRSTVEPIPLDTLARLARDRHRSGRLQTDYLVSDDGLVVPDGIYDRDANASCELPYFASEGAYACRPSSRSIEPLVAASCDLATVTDETSTGVLFSEYEGECPVYFQQGTQIEGGVCLERFETATVMRVPDAGSTERLRQIYLEGDGLSRPDPGRFHDTLLDTECFVSDGAEGSVLCRPRTDTLEAKRFSDPACTVELDVAIKLEGHDNCIERKPPRYVPKQGAFYERGELYTGPAYQHWGEMCVEAYETFYTFGARVPDERLARGHRIHD